MEPLNEELLGGWMRLSLAIMNERMVSDLPYNETLLCHILYRQQQDDPDTLLTATDLCARTRMLKSQMNQTLSSMEQRGLISRERSSRDKRQILIRLNAQPSSAYMQQHRKILAITDELIDRFGEEKTREIIAMFETIIDTVQEVLN